MNFKCAGVIMKHSSWFAIFLIASLAFAQSYQTASVLKWELKPYSKSAHIIKDHIVYLIRIGNSRYEIARRSKKIELSIGEQVDCRLAKGVIYVRNPKGKEIKYEIVGIEPAE